MDSRYPVLGRQLGQFGWGVEIAKVGGIDRHLDHVESIERSGHGASAADLSIAVGGGMGVAARRHPDWIKARIPTGETYTELKRLLGGLALNTVCEEARCPNIGECWDQRTATIMILGDVCTRACGFCAIKTGRPTWFDDDEPRRVAEAVRPLGLGGWTDAGGRGILREP